MSLLFPLAIFASLLRWRRETVSSQPTKRRTRWRWRPTAIRTRRTAWTDWSGSRASLP